MNRPIKHDRDREATLDPYEWDREFAEAWEAAGRQRNEATLGWLRCATRGLSHPPVPPRLAIEKMRGITQLSKDGAASSLQIDGELAQFEADGRAYTRWPRTQLLIVELDSGRVRGKERPSGTDVVLAGPNGNAARTADITELASLAIEWSQGQTDREVIKAVVEGGRNQPSVENPPLGPPGGRAGATIPRWEESKLGQRANRCHRGVTMHWLEIFHHARLAVTVEWRNEENETPPVFRAQPLLAELSIDWGSRNISTRDLENWASHLTAEDERLREQEAEATRVRARQGLGPCHGDLWKILWGTADEERAGAIAMVAYDASARAVRTAPSRVQSKTLSEREIAELLRARGRDRERMPSAQSGHREKISIRWNAGSATWIDPRAGELGTHIIKEESGRNWLPGEAGVESLCQRVIGYVGIPAAKTRARIFGGRQCIVSERADRRWQGEEVVPVHQEEWSQAAGFHCTEKYWDASGAQDSGYETIGRLLAVSGNERNARELCRTIAAISLLGNHDGHRRNLGLQREGGEVRLAPVYDFSSSFGVLDTGEGQMQIPVGGETFCDALTWQHWRRLAEQLQIDPDIAYEELRAVAQELPDALEQARGEAASEDEVAEKERWGTRAEVIQRRSTELCARALKPWRGELRRRGTDRVTQATRRLRARVASDREAMTTVKVDKASPVFTIHWHNRRTNETEKLHACDGEREAATVVSNATGASADEEQQLERSLVRERRQMERGKDLDSG